MLVIDQFAGKYVAVVGLARSGVAAAEALLLAGAKVILQDRLELEKLLAGADTEFAERVNKLAAADNVTLALGSDDLGSAAAEIDLLVKSPGVPAQAQVVAQAKAAGIEVIGEIELGVRMRPDLQILGITGTNGKTTTTALTTAIFEAAGIAVYETGNVGLPLCEILEHAPEAAYVVCELSSFQLEDSVSIKPKVAALLNLQPDHIDRHGSVENYRAAKLRIFANQDTGDLAVIGPTVSEFELPGQAKQIWLADPNCGLTVRDGRVIFGSHSIGVSQIKLRGKHNLENVMVASAIADAAGVSWTAIDTTLREFAGVEHRLQLVAKIGDVEYVNDSKATNVAAALVALDAFPDHSVHLVAGGRAKGESFAELRGLAELKCQSVHLYGEAAEQMASAFAGSGLEVLSHERLEDAVQAASNAANLVARSGAEHREAEVSTAANTQTVLLSPACASFDQFDNYEQRGDKFAEIVAGLGAL